jgi:hypothetical protein
MGIQRLVIGAAALLALTHPVSAGLLIGVGSAPEGVVDNLELSLTPGSVFAVPFSIFSGSVTGVRITGVGSLENLLAPDPQFDAYITDYIGPSCEFPGNCFEYAHKKFDLSVLDAGEVEVWNDLNLAPGTYYLTIGSTSALVSGGWSAAQSPVTQVWTSGAARGDGFYDQYWASEDGVNAYLPASAFGGLDTGPALMYRIEGTPEPSTWFLTVTAGAALLAVRRRRGQKKSQEELRG